MIQFPAVLTHFSVDGEVSDDFNATFGYDRFNNSWFVKGFPYIDEQGFECLSVNFGNTQNENNTLESMLEFLRDNNFTLYVNGFINLYDFFPSSGSALFQTFNKKASIYAFIYDSFIQANAEVPDLNFAVFLEDFVVDINESESYLKLVAETVVPQLANKEIILKEILDSYLTHFDTEEANQIRENIGRVWTL